MGYLHIQNLYKDKTILMFRECYALEKVHGTSAHIRYTDGHIVYFNGGENRDRFIALFDEQRLRDGFSVLGHKHVTIYGEAYGGKQQGMRDTYGEALCFIVFDVRVGDTWLAVPDMAQVACGLGLDVVPWCRVSTDLTELDALMDAPSEVAQLRGCGKRPREGVVLRPLVEFIMPNGGRVIAKHKGAAFSERATPQKVVDPDTFKVLAEADAIAQEWVTPMRLEHVLQKIPDVTIERMREVISAMVGDVYREAAGEIVESKMAASAIGRRTSRLFVERLNNQKQRDASRRSGLPQR